MAGHNPNPDQEATDDEVNDDNSMDDNEDISDDAKPIRREGLTKNGNENYFPQFVCRKK